ncbi:hypothetical protein QBC36DRAFT_70438 [Triangularia setosa]|uniref:2EXR domain-containing protein n=1 Tax=Triangularia setosa TaxID=2587417 RepID=A0AAN7A9Y6_9PEZI|nr:hypothetical protein QBC36DRAFT_70438 [Podospora setosa]
MIAIMTLPAPNMADQQLPGTQNGPYKYLRLFMDDTVPSVPAWRLTRFPELPDELQVMIWEMALESEHKKVPRIISVCSFLPPAREIHVARVLAQTCVKSREVALRCLSECALHEENHRFYSETPEELRSSDASLRANAELVNRRLPPRPLDALVIRPRTRSTSLRATETTPIKRDTDHLRNPLHNHAHIDRDYLLFTGIASKVLRLNILDAQSFVYGVQKIMVPSTVLWSLFSQSMFGGLDMGQNLLKAVKEVVILLPISMKLFSNPSLSNPSRCPSLSTSGFLARILKDVAHKENQRWAQASEVPYNLIRFWTDEEMAAFAASCSDREKYQPWNHDASSSNNINQNANNNIPASNQLPLLNNTSHPQGPNYNQSLLNVVDLLQQNGFLPGSSAHETAQPSNLASSLDSPSPSVSGTTTPEHFKPFADRVTIFRGMQETNSFLYGLFQCWKALYTGAEGEKAPVVRFAHVKGTETEQDLEAILTRFNGTPEKKCGLDWRDYIPAQSAEEIRSEVLRRESPLTNVKMSQRYSASGEFEVETLNNTGARGTTALGSGAASAGGEEASSWEEAAGGW